MSNPTLEQRFETLLNALIDDLNLKGAKIARESGVSIYIINAARNNRPYNVDIDTYNSLLLYYKKKTAPPEEQYLESKLQGLEEEITELKKQIAAMLQSMKPAAMSKTGKKEKNQMLADNS